MPVVDATARTEPAPPGARRTIVVVEDDAAIRDLVRRVLEEAGYRVVVAPRSAEAAALVRAERPALVLCDIAMPDLDGYGVLKALQEDTATAGVPVVFLTAHQEFTERVRAFGAGIVDYVAKPFTRAVLLKKVDRVLAGLGPREEVVAPNDPPELPDTSAAERPTFRDIPDVLRTVLLVDDNAVFRTFVRELLTEHGFTVHEAASGEEGLRLALERRPWLILTDVRMPGEDGFAFCRRVRAHSLLRQTPLLFLSGWDDYKARYRALELGADDFLSKETPVRELLIRIRLTLMRHVVGGSRRPGAGMQGNLQVMGAPGVLQTCHLMRLTGTLVVDDGSRHVDVRFRDGELAGAKGDGREGQDAVFALLGWEHGTFRFVPGDPGDGEPLGPFSQIVLEGCRRLDEAQRVEAEGSAAAVAPDVGPAPAD